MKTQIMKGASILTAMLFFSMLLAPVFAAPQQPFDRLGDTTYNTTVCASWIDGVQYGTATTSGTGYLEISTDGDDTAQATEKIGGNAGDIIQYSVGSLTGATGRFFAVAENDVFAPAGSFTGDLTADGADTILLKIDVVATQATAGVTDYVIIYNPHTAAVNAGGYSLAVGTAAAQAIVVGDIPAGLATNNNINIPAGGSLVINMVKWGGLSNTGNSVKLIYTTGTRVVDRVEYGTIATEPENTIMTNAAAPASAQEIYRNGHADTNACAVDFLSRAQTVIPDLTAPTITATTIADNAVDQAIAAGVYEATWSEAMAAVGTVTTNLPGAVFTWPSTTVYRITYTALAYSTVYTITYNGFTDVVGNAATGDLAKQFTTIAAPMSTATITSLAPLTPSNDNTPTFTYSVANAPTSAEIYYATVATGPYQLWGTDTPATSPWTPGAGIADNTYYFAARGIGATSEAVPTASEYGPYVIDTVAPTITATTIADNAIDQAIAAGTYEATWSEAMAAVGTVTTNLPGAVFTWPSTTVYRITYTALAYSTVYTITYNGFTDLATNAATGDLAKQFTTIAASMSTATITGVAPASPSNDNTPDFTYTVTNAPSSAEIYYATVATGPYQLWGTDTPATSPWTPGAGIADNTYYFAARGIGATSEAVPTASEFGPYVIDTTAPVANAGADMAISVATQKNDATATDATSGVATTVWTFPANVICSNINILNPTFSASAAGDYTVTLTVTDNVGLTHQDTFLLTWSIIGSIPAQVNNLNAAGHTPTAADCRLTWTEMVGATSYNVYRALGVNGHGFDFGTVYANVPASGTGTVVWDNVGAYSTADSYAWVVRSVGSGENTTDKDNIAFKLVKTFITGSAAVGPANNFFALPYKSSFIAAATLLTDMRTYGAPTNAVTSLNRWNQNTGVWENKPPVGGTNFVVKPGEGYFAIVNQPSVVYKMVGAYNSSVFYSLFTGSAAIGPANNYFALPYHCTMLTAATLLTSMRSAGTPTNAVTSLNRWNQNTGVWENKPPVGGTNFVVTPGEAYFAIINQPTVTWTAPVLTPGV